MTKKEIIKELKLAADAYKAAAQFDYCPDESRIEEVLEEGYDVNICSSQYVDYSHREIADTIMDLIGKL